MIFEEAQRIAMRALPLTCLSRKLKELQASGYPVGEPVLRGLSPYHFAHINRFGDYMLDLDRAVDPIDYGIKFS